MNTIDKALANVIIQAYEKQRSFDTAVVVVFKSKDSIIVGNQSVKLSRTSREVTLLNRLERLKKDKTIFSYEKQGSGKVIKVLIREVRKQADNKKRFLRQVQLQLF